MRRRLILAAATAATALMIAAPASATPTCAGVFGTSIANHAEHIVGDYVTGIGGMDGTMGWPPSGQVGKAVAESGGAAVKGGPGPGHFAIGFAPGASFCVEQRAEFTIPGPFQS